MAQHPDNPFEHAIEEALAAMNADYGVTFESHPEIGTSRPDFVVDSPSGKFVVEVKTGGTASTLSSLAQVAAYRDLGAGTPLLFAIGPDAQDLVEAGPDFDVAVFGTNATEPHEAAENLKHDFIAFLDGPSDGTASD